jgi:hypothetical protein
MIAGGIAGFGLIAGGLIRILPAPHTRLHYLIAGTAATAAALAAALTWIHHQGLFRGGVWTGMPGRRSRRIDEEAAGCDD